VSLILFANSYFIRQDPKEFRAKNYYAPLGTLYAASYMKSLGYKTALFDTMLAETPENLLGEIRKHKPGIFVIYDDVFNYLTKMCLTKMREAAFIMSKIAHENGCKVIISGSDAADHLEKYFRNDADYVICGEGEITLGELIASISGKNTISRNEINGLAFIENGRIVKTLPRSPVKDPDILPYPAWELVDMAEYERLWKKHHGYFSTNLVTTRGCPFHCNWCAKPIYGQVYNSHSPQYVAGMVKYLKENYSPDHIWFCDDIFGLKPGWVNKFSEIVNREKLQIPFKCLSRADLLLKENNISSLAKAGCDSIWIGAESGSQKILDAMEKGTTIAQINEATCLLKKNNIRTCFFIQFGYTGETIREINMTRKMINSLMPDDIGISVSYPLPGTKFYERVVSEMSEKKNWTDSGDFEMMFSGEYSTRFYRTLHKLIHKEFRTKQIIKKPFKNFCSLWKLPYYLFFWVLFALMLMIQEKSERKTHRPGSS
jgi:radical SAM superfamily enzyme YgiQ (UPF0313 family)